MQLLRLNGYNPLTSGFITVAVSRSENPSLSALLHEFLSDHYTIPDRLDVYLVDGHHRVTSLQKLVVQDDKIIKNNQIFRENGVTQVALLYRTDSADIFKSEIVKYAAGSNNMNSSVLSSRDFISSMNILHAYNKNFLQDQKVRTRTIKTGTL